MADREFFKLDQEQWYEDFVDQEVYEINQDTSHHNKIFDIEDVPFWEYNRILDSAETNLKGHMMTATVKPVNYTPEQTVEIVQAYQAGETVEAIAERTGKSTRSIVAKLSREGVYRAKGKAKSEQVVRKADLIAEIAHSIDANEELLESLEKATKEALELIARAVKAWAI